MARIWNQLHYCILYIYSVIWMSLCKYEVLHKLFGFKFVGSFLPIYIQVGDMWVSCDKGTTRNKMTPIYSEWQFIQDKCFKIRSA